MSEDRVLLLEFWASPFCLRTKLALAEKGVPYVAQEEKKLFTNKSELLLKSNPIYQRVPVLFHNGKPVCESTNIVYYIDEAWPSPSLLPSSPYERSRARFWADFMDKKVFDAGCQIWQGQGAAVEAGVNAFIDSLKKLEGALGERDFFNGDCFGFLDIIAIGLSSWFPAYEKYGGFKIAERCPKFAAWQKKCGERKTVAKILPSPQQIIEFVGMMRKMYGIE